jgi:hypothetical protein
MELSYWLPMSPLEGPPLPAGLKIYWPWYNKVTVQISGSGQGQGNEILYTGPDQSVTQLLGDNINKVSAVMKYIDGQWINVVNLDAMVYSGLYLAIYATSNFTLTWTKV